MLYKLQKFKSEFSLFFDFKNAFQASESLQDDEVLSQNAALFLKYNVLKKLALLAEKDLEKEKAIQYYLEVISWKFLFMN